MGKLNLDQKVSAHLAFALVIVLGFLVAWYSLAAAQEIIANSKESSGFNIQARIQKELPKQK